MAERKVDVEFATNEKLWRRIESADINKTTMRIKGNRLRLQVSVVREKHGEIQQVPREKWTGVAETTAAAAAGLIEGSLSFVCADEPLKEDSGHALIAMVLVPGQTLDVAVRDELRMRLGESFQVVVPPRL